MNKRGDTNGTNLVFGREFNIIGHIFFKKNLFSKKIKKIKIRISRENKVSQMPISFYMTSSSKIFSFHNEHTLKEENKRTFINQWNALKN